MTYPLDSAMVLSDLSDQDELTCNKIKESIILGIIRISNKHLEQRNSGELFHSQHSTTANHMLDKFLFIGE
jgi:hypothetical protein